MSAPEYLTKAELKALEAVNGGRLWTWLERPLRRADVLDGLTKLAAGCLGHAGDCEQAVAVAVPCPACTEQAQAWVAKWQQDAAKYQRMLDMLAGAKPTSEPDAAQTGRQPEAGNGDNPPPPAADTPPKSDKRPRGDDFRARMRRARKDPVATLIAAAGEVGVRFRISGADLVVGGAAGLAPADLATLREHLGEVRARLEPETLGSDDPDLLDVLGVELEVVTTEARALEVVAGLPAAVGFDVETEPRPEHTPSPRWLVLTTDGRISARQPKERDKVGRDPHRARPRLAQIYDPDTETVYVLDLHLVPLEALEGLWSRRLVIHNAAFELAMLHGLPRDTVCTQQMAGLLLGTAWGSRRLATVAELVLGLELPKGQQVSDWSAARLSEQQLVYAAADAVIAHRAGREMWRRMGAPERRAFEAQNSAVQVVARMGLLGLPFDQAVHRATVEQWEREHAEARAAFVAATGAEVPPPGPQRSGWLEDRLTELAADELKWWPRTSTGGLSCKAEDLKRIAWADWARPLIAVANADHRLRAFGRKLIAAVSPVTGRLHGGFMPCGQKAGRTSCSAPNLLGLPPEARRAVVAPEGRVLVVADYSQIELRVAAELSRDPAMRQVFRAGGDLHRLTAAAVAGLAEANVSPEQRQAAKAVNFGVLYGQGAKGLRATAWADYGLDMTIGEAERARAALRGRYPELIAWQRQTVDEAEATGLLRSVLGRPLRAEWERGGRIRYTLACNFRVQSSAADVLLVAMAKAAAALAGLDAELILQVHDELVLEVAETDADAARGRLVEAMREAWLEVFPGAPDTGLVDARVAKCWAKG